ncbi:MAG: MBL fold metallo-hydrolase [Dehalococcoidia bacterium]
MQITDNVYYFPESGMMDCNTYVIRDDITVLIDPGLDHYLPMLTEALNKEGIDPESIDMIVNTHLHLDHYWATESLKRLTDARIMLHPLQKESYNTTVIDVTKVFGMDPVHIHEDGLLDSNLNTGNLDFQILSTPGHSPDSITFYCEDKGIIICGDVVFAGNTGRVDFPGGSGKQLKESINALSKLNAEHLLPGHMGIVSGAEKVRQNFEFVRKNVFPWL